MAAAAQNMTHAEVEELELALGTSSDAGLQRQMLLAVRMRKMRRPDLVLRFGPGLLARGGVGGAEAWDVREQVVVAALELHVMGTAEEQLVALETKFPGSKRVRILRAMYYEAAGGQSKISTQEAEAYYQEASNIYDEIIKEEPTNGHARKRRICNLRGVGSPEALAEALKQMNEYLDLFPMDFDAWRELGDMHLEIGSVEAARFAFEEVVMLSPINHVNHTILADCLYTLGDHPTARKYYAQSLELKPEHNARAAIGLILTTSAIAASRGAKAEDKANNEPLFECGRTLLLEAYDALGPADAGASVGALVKKWVGGA